MASQTQGTFNVEEVCKDLQKAMKGLGTDEDSIIRIVTSHSNAQRQEIRDQYKRMYGKALIDDIKGELSGHFENSIVGLLMAPDEYDAYSVHKAVKGLGTDEAALIEVLASRTTKQLTAAKEFYKKQYGKELEKAVATDTSGDFRKLLVSLITAERDLDGPVDHARAVKDAKDLFDAGEAKWGTDESTFNAILATRSYAHVRAVGDEYKKISKRTLEQAVKSEMSGDLERGYLAILQVASGVPEYFAERLYKAMKGLGTDDTCLTRVMVSRSEIDLPKIKAIFQTKYGKPLSEFIKSDTSGDYRKTLLAICGA